MSEFTLPSHSFDQGESQKRFVHPGDRMFVPCEGGPCLSRLERFPPRLEIEEPDGTYVLVDEGRPDEWRYVFVPHEY